MSTKIPDLEIDESDGLIELTQSSGGEHPNSIYLHQVHLRYLAERFGLLETSDSAALCRIATLERRLRVLKTRIDHLGRYLCLHSDSEHADLTYEQDYANATADISDEFCADLGGPVAWATSVANAQSVTSAAPQVKKSAAERAKDYRARKRHTVTEPRDASPDAVTPNKTGQLELKQ